MCVCSTSSGWLIAKGDLGIENHTVRERTPTQNSGDFASAHIAFSTTPATFSFPIYMYYFRAKKHIFFLSEGLRAIIVNFVFICSFLLLLSQLLDQMPKSILELFVHQKRTRLKVFAVPNPNFHYYFVGAPKIDRLIKCQHSNFTFSFSLNIDVKFRTEKKLSSRIMRYHTID